jgi:hypothetical protein
VPVAGTRAVGVRVGRYALELGMALFKPVVESLKGCEVGRFVFDGGRVRAARKRHAGETQEEGRPALDRVAELLFASVHDRPLTDLGDELARTPALVAFCVESTEISYVSRFLGVDCLCPPPASARARELRPTSVIQKRASPPACAELYLQMPSMPNLPQM